MKAYDEAKGFYRLKNDWFIPNHPVIVKIIDVQRDVGHHFLNPNLYTIQIKHSHFEWTVKKRYKDFTNLHQQLRLFRASLTIPMPMKAYKERRKTLKSEKKIMKLARFPQKPEALVSQENLQKRAVS